MAQASRRERRKATTRRTIQLAAWRLVAERGFDAVTVPEISDAADIAPRTFFGYCSSKEDALALDRLWTADRMREVIASRPAGERPLESLRVLAQQMSAEITADRELMVLIQRAMRRDPLYAHRLVGTLEERVEAVARVLAERLGLDARDPYPLLAATVALSAGQAAVQLWLGAVETSPAEAGATPERFIDEAFDLLKQGLDRPA
jgi:AcrR family transcriptional regulator